MQGKFNSSDIYGSIEVGKKYTFVIVGERSGFLSMYPNIVKVVE
jgi:cytosine/adenosine deaminase-related metal-dependent hydrolase